MTGSPIGLRRYSNCNLHCYAPMLKKDRNSRLGDPPPLYNRRKLYILPEHLPTGFVPASRLYRVRPKYGIDEHGPYLWMVNDCLYEWLSTRPGIYHIRPLESLFYAIHEHVHAPHRERKINLALEAQRVLVRILKSPTLDERLGTQVYPDAHRYRVQVRMTDITEDEDRYTRLIASLAADPALEFSIRTDARSARTTVIWHERASNPTHARERAQRRLKDAGVGLGGTFWETPVRVLESSKEASA